VGFRKPLIERDLDRRLVERTVKLTRRTGGFGARALRAALDSSPLWGRAGCASQPSGTGSVGPLVLTSRWACALARLICTMDSCFPCLLVTRRDRRSRAMVLSWRI
jgi:hypothetical protein